MGNELTDVERPRLNDDLHKHPLRPAPHAVDPSDNLPRPMMAAGLEDTLAPPMTPENLICMGDESVFVIRDDWGDVLARVSPEKVRRDRSGNCWVARGELSEEARERARSEMQAAFNENPERYLVEPLRPQCVFYKRVMTSFDGQTQGLKDLKHVGRVCTAQRGETGEFVSLGATEVFACEHRQPRDFVSEERLRRFDERVVEQSRKAEETWDPEAAITESLGGSAKE